MAANEHRESGIRRRFAEAVQRGSEQVDLARAALLIAKEEYPSLDEQACLTQLDQMAERVSQRLEAERLAKQVIAALNAHLFDELGFRGNAQDYYDPRNSFLNDVLERRVGIPITLSLVYMEVARRLDFDVQGVGMPGHFLVKHSELDREYFIDPYHKGAILTEADCEARLAQVYQRPVKFESAFLTTVDSKQVLVRMLNNLKHVYLSQSAWDKALAAVERALLVSPKDATLHKEKGLLNLQVRQVYTAIADLNTYLELAPEAPDAPQVKELIANLWRGLSQKN